MKKVPVLSIQRFSVHDGKGIRTTIFLKGCPLRCLWCANPESQLSKKELMVDAKTCINCGSCIKVCKIGALEYLNGMVNIHREKCVTCGSCTKVCPVNALKIAGKEMGYEEILEIIKRDKEFYDNSGGGITVSGGEPTLYPDFLKFVALECEKNKIHRALETCGFFNWNALNGIIGMYNLIFFDIKIVNLKKHIKLTGQSNDIIINNLQKLSNKYSKKLEIIIRYPLIPGYNDGWEDIEALANLIKKIDNNLPLQVLPYHRLGISKYDQTGRNYQLIEVKPPDSKEMEEVEKQLRGYHLNINHFPYSKNYIE